MCRALALPVPGSSIPGGERRSGSRPPQSPTGTGAVRPGVPRLRPALPDPSPARTRAAVPARVSPTAVTACPQRRNGRTLLQSPQRPREPTPFSCRGCLGEKGAGRNPTGPSREGCPCAGTRPAGGTAGGQSGLCLFIFSRTESLICVCRGGRREEAGVHARLSSLPLPALVRLGSHPRQIPV